MTIQGIILGFIIATLIGSLLHLIVGGSLLRLVVFILLSWIGFWMGHIFAYLMQWTFMKFGALQLAGGLLGNFIVLGLGYWLSLVKPDATKP